MNQKNQESQQQLNVESYEFEPIKGYPMLNWKGKRPFTSTQYFPAQLKESYGKPGLDGWMNKIFWGDNLQVMSHLLKDFRGKIDLIYIDPPFDSKADYKKRIQIKGKTAESTVSSFEEKQYQDIWANDEYLQFMYDRFILLRELLSSKGTIYVHLDWHRSAQIRLILDEVFGVENFINEIIWKRGNNKKSTNKFSINHDNIFAYSKTSDYFFKPQFQPFSEEYIHEKYPNIENGRRYQLQAMYGKGDGPALYFGDKLLKPPPGLHWRWGQDRINQAMKDGIIVFPRGGEGMPRFKDFLDTKEGVPIRTIWDDIPEVNSQALEREAYPTIKPVALIERIIESSSEPGDLFLDCFCGSGSSLIAAAEKGRKFIGSDINSAAVKISCNRLISKYASLPISLFNVNSYDLFRSPTEAKEIILHSLEVSLLKNSIFDGEKDGRMVKIMPVNRIAAKSDLNDLINGFDRKSFEKRQKENPNKPVEKILLVCMGHEPDLKAHLEKDVEYKLDVEIVDILRDKQDLQFKRESEAKIKVKKDKLVIEKFFPMNLLQKLSLQKEKVTDWRELVESVLIDWNYDGAVLEPQLIDIPEKDELVKGEYEAPKDAGTIRVKITDLLSESIEVEVSRD